MLLVSSYVMAPGCCKLCGGNATPAVDTERDIDQDAYEGRLYICGLCIGSLATTFGWVSPDVLADVNARACDAESAAELAKSLMEEARRAQAVAEATLETLREFGVRRPPPAKKAPAKVGAAR